MGQQAKEIDGKVCKKKVWGVASGATGGSNRLGRAKPDDGVWSCVDYTVPSDNTGKNEARAKPGVDGLMWRFGNAGALKQREDKHATANADDANTGQGYTNSGWPGTTSAGTETADGIASDLSGLQRTEKTKVADLLSKTIPGAEVKNGCVRCC